MDGSQETEHEADLWALVSLQVTVSCCPQSRGLLKMYRWPKPETSHHSPGTDHPGTPTQSFDKGHYIIPSLGHMLGLQHALRCVPSGGGQAQALP